MALSNAVASTSVSSGAAEPLVAGAAGGYVGSDLVRRLSRQL